MTAAPGQLAAPCLLKRPQVTFRDQYARTRAREADDGGKGRRLADAWPPGRGSTSVTTSQARCSAAPRRGTCRLPGSLLPPLDARHEQRLQRDRPAVRAGVFNLLLVAIFLRSHLADQPFARIDLQPTMFDHIGFGGFDSRIIPFTPAYGLSALLRSIGDLMDFVE